MIKDSLLNKFPQWYKDLDPNKYYLVLSNDFDSYLSCNILTELFGLEVGGFYEFESGLWLNADRTEGKEPIYVDLSIAKGKTFDNHLTFIENPLAINPNVETPSYFRKYNGSTLALICALYGYDTLDTKRLTTLLCVDGWYCGYYNQNGKYRDINIHWYETLGMCDKLLPILEQNNKAYFLDFIQRYKLDATIFIKNKTLHCDAKISLPECRFDLVMPVKKSIASKEKVREVYESDPDSIIISAETFKNNYIINRKD